MERKSKKMRIKGKGGIIKNEIEGEREKKEKKG